MAKVSKLGPALGNLRKSEDCLLIFKGADVVARLGTKEDLPRCIPSRQCSTPPSPKPHASDAFQALLATHGIVASLSRRGDRATVVSHPLRIHGMRGLGGTPNADRRFQARCLDEA